MKTRNFIFGGDNKSFIGYKHCGPGEWKVFVQNHPEAVHYIVKILVTERIQNTSFNDKTQNFATYFSTEQKCISFLKKVGSKFHFEDDENGFSIPKQQIKVVVGNKEISLTGECREEELGKKMKKLWNLPNLNISKKQPLKSIDTMKHTKESLEPKTVSELREIASKSEIKGSSRMKKEDLISNILSLQKEEPSSDGEVKKTPGRHVLEIHLSKKEEEIRDNSGLKKSEKVRQLFDGGREVKEIYHILDVDYVFAYDVITAYKKKKDEVKEEVAA